MSADAPTRELGPALVVRDPDGPVRAVTLLLPGGKADSFDPTPARQLSALRMVPFADSLHRTARPDGMAVWLLRYRLRGWNGSAASPTADVQWALQEVLRRHGQVPVVLVGHSMGGRAAVHAGGAGTVQGVVALAPWLPDREPVDQLAGRQLLIAHGSLDMITSARASQRYAERAGCAGAVVGRAVVRGDTHAMLFRAPTWHRLATSAALVMAGLGAPTGRLQRIFDRGRGGDFAVAV